MTDEKNTRKEEFETVSVFDLVRYTMVKDFYLVTERYGYLVTAHTLDEFSEALRLFRAAASSLFFKLYPKQRKLNEIDLAKVHDVIFSEDGNIPSEISRFRSYRKAKLEDCKEVVKIFGEALETLGYTNVEFIDKSRTKSAIISDYLKTLKDIDV